VSMLHLQGKYGGQFWGYVHQLRVRCSAERHAKDASEWTTLANNLQGASSQHCDHMASRNLPTSRPCRTLRFFPLKWAHYPSMRVQVYGCAADQFHCRAPLMKLGAGLFQASSSDAAPACSPDRAVIVASGRDCNDHKNSPWPSWCPAAANSNEWLQLDFGDKFARIHQITVQGKYGGPKWGAVRELEVKCSRMQFPKGDGDWTLVPGVSGASDQMCKKAVTSKLSKPVECRTLLFRPLKWTHWPSMSVQIHGCLLLGGQPSCSLPLTPEGSDASEEKGMLSTS